LELRSVNRPQERPTDIELFRASIGAQQNRRKMTGVAVRHPALGTIDLRKKRCHERRDRPQIAKVPINFRGNVRRVRTWTAIILQEPNEVCEPHSCRETFPCDVSKCRQDGKAMRRQYGKIARQIVGREGLGRECHTAMMQSPRAAQFALNLCGLKELCMQVKPLSEQ